MTNVINQYFCVHQCDPIMYLVIRNYILIIINTIDNKERPDHHVINVSGRCH